jgi:hypothetical protein
MAEREMTNRPRMDALGVMYEVVQGWGVGVGRAMMRGW